MAKQQGGYRRPANPAPVSGPGKLSRRTDGGPSSKSAVQGVREMSGGGKYGERKALEEAQSGAPMAGNPVSVTTPAMPSSAPVGGPATGLFDPSQRPNEPVTSGLPVGPGRTPAAEMTGNYDMIMKYMPALELMASQEDAPEPFRALVKYVKVTAEQV
jgi:hypothetical protein